MTEAAFLTSFTLGLVAGAVLAGTFMMWATDTFFSVDREEDIDAHTGKDGRGELA